MIHHRVIELYFASVMTVLGMILLADGSTFDTQFYAYIRDTMHEEVAGAILLCAGTVRMLAILINGAWRPSPPLRFLGCIIGAQFWGLMAVSFWVGATSGIPGMLAWCVPAGAFEIYSAGRAMTDAVRMRSFSLFHSGERADVG